MDDIEQFKAERIKRIEEYPGSKAQAIADDFIAHSMNIEYQLSFDWLSVPIIQYPQDIVAMQELVWSSKPDLIIETGIARGGSMVFYASMLALLDLEEGKAPLAEGVAPKRKILGIDIDFREHNNKNVDDHFLRNYMEFINRSSLDPETISEVSNIAKKHNSVLVTLDSNHTHEHVLSELKLYSPFVSVGSHCVVFDTFLNKLDDSFIGRKPERHGTHERNAGTAMREFIENIDSYDLNDINGNPVTFAKDASITDKLLVTTCSEGYLRRTA